MDLYYLVSPFCLIGAGSNLLIITAFLKNSDLPKIYEYRFILIFSVFDLLTNLSSLLPSLLLPNNHLLCILQGMLIQTSSLSGILWIGLIAIAILREFVLVKSRFSSGFFKPLFIIISFSALSAVLPLIFNAYKLSGTWCWFESPDASHYTRDYLLRFLLYYVFVWSVIIFNFIVTVAVRYKVKKETIHDFVGNRLVNRLKFYPWILCFCYIPLTFVRALEGIQTVPLWFSVFAGIQLRCISPLNAIAFFRLDKTKLISPNPSKLSPAGYPLKHVTDN